MHPDEYRRAVGRFATGVTVVTTTVRGGSAALTANSFTSVSLDPVLLLVCINNRLPTHGAIEASRRFVVNVLGEGQAELALRFARPGIDKFDGVELVPGSELPILADAIAHFTCDVHERFPGGDHSIFIGLVRSCAATPGKRPLVYFKSGFGALRDPESELLRETLGWDMPSLSGATPVRVDPQP